jgi:hypothetical protein
VAVGSLDNGGKDNSGGWWEKGTERQEPMGFSEHTSVAYNSFPTLGLTNNVRLVVFSENNYHGM